MSDKIKRAHEHIEGTDVAMIILDFSREFRDTYPRHVFERMCAVGPLQSLIGHAIANGRLSNPRAKK